MNGFPLRRLVRLSSAAGVALALTGAASASAATVAVDGGVLTYTAASGKVNVLAFDESGANQVDITDFNSAGTDADPMTPGAGCTQTAAGPPQVVRCTGVNSLVVNLGDRDDTADGSGVGPGLSTLPMTVNAGDGNDALTGGGGKDTLNGENGNDGGGFGDFSGGGDADTLNGGAGDDSNMDGGQGNDTIDGGAGTDTINDTGFNNANPSTPAVPNDTSNDTITGGDGDDTVTAGAGNDTVDGGDGDDTLTGGLGADGVTGGGGDDTLLATEDNAADTYNGGSGNDTVGYAVYGADVKIALTGGSGGNGATGDNDTIGNDVENAAGGAGNDTIAGNDADNILSGNGGNDTIAGGAGNDTLNGGDATDTLAGGEGNDTLNGGSGNDTLGGENGNDMLTGGSGNDVYNGGAGIDVADFSDLGQNVSVTLDGQANDGQSGDTDNADADGAVENIQGGFGDDTLIGNALVNFIDGGAGNDTINGVDNGFLTDLLICGAGSDVAAGDALDYIELTGSERCETVLRAAIDRVASTTTLTTSPARDKKAPYTFAAKGAVAFDAAVPAADGCKGTVVVTYRAGKTTVATKRPKLKSDCTYKTSARIKLPKKYHGKKRLTVIARFAGNRFVEGSVAPVRKPQAG